MAKQSTTSATTTTSAKSKGKGKGIPAPAPAPAVVPSAKPKALPQQFGVARRADLPWGPNKQAVLAALLAAGATSEASAITTGQAIAAGAPSQRHLRHYTYHAQAGGLCVVLEHGAGMGHRYYLTGAGVKELGAHGVVVPSARAKAPKAKRTPKA